MARNFSYETTDKVAWSGGPILYNQTSASIFGWFKNSGVAANKHLFNQRAGWPNIFQFELMSTGAVRGWVLGNNYGGSSTTFGDGAWHRFLMVRRPASLFVEGYVDGGSEFSTASDPGTNSSSPTTQVWGNSDVGNMGFGGDLARCGFISGVALTIQQADSFLYTGRWPDLLDQWLEMFGESPEPDWSGNGLNGTVTGTTIVDHAPAGPPFGFDIGFPFPAAVVGADVRKHIIPAYMRAA